MKKYLAIDWAIDGKLTSGGRHVWKDTVHGRIRKPLNRTHRTKS